MPGPAGAGGMRGPAVGPSGAFCVCRPAWCPRRLLSGAASSSSAALGVCRPARCPRRLPSGVASSASAVQRAALGVCRPPPPPGAYTPGLVSASVRKAVQAASLLRSSASCMTA